jgi:hypothetical protein
MKLMIITISLVCIYVSLPSSVLPEEVDGGGLGLWCTGTKGVTNCSFKDGTPGLCGFAINDVLVTTGGRKDHKSPDTNTDDCSSSSCSDKTYPRAHMICNAWEMEI